MIFTFVILLGNIDNHLMVILSFSMIFYGLTIVFYGFYSFFYGLWRWLFYTFSMVCRWFFYGLFLSFLYGFLPFSMVPLYSFRVFMAFYWSITGNLWLLYGFSMVYYWFSMIFYDFYDFILCYKFGLKNTHTMWLVDGFLFC